MAIDLAKYNIRVNSVCPNIVLTPRTKKYFADKKYNKYIKENTPINKVVTVSDVATSVVSGVRCFGSGDRNIPFD